MGVFFFLFDNEEKTGKKNVSLFSIDDDEEKKKTKQNKKSVHGFTSLLITNSKQNSSLSEHGDELVSLLHASVHFSEKKNDVPGRRDGGKGGDCSSDGDDCDCDCDCDDDG